MTEDEMTAGARFKAERDGEWTVVTMRIPIEDPKARHGAWTGEEAKRRMAMFFLRNTASLLSELGATPIGKALEEFALMLAVGFKEVDAERRKSDA